MITTAYKKQVALLLSVLPEVGKEECFALHGGTAINLFVREMPRLSVDIDLTYVPIEDRITSIVGINDALSRVKTNLEKALPDVSVIEQREKGKLQISRAGVRVKLEVNLVGRGTLGSCEEMPLCQKAQEEFDAFCAVRIVPFEQLYGGKICAALDRQHPRDLFDVKYLLENEGFTKRIKRGFIYCLLGSDRPLHEIIIPNFQDQRSALENHFAGMSAEEFTYEEYESERLKLVEAIGRNLNDEDKRFLLGFCSFEPDWDVYDFKGYPSVEWKLRNLQKLKELNRHELVLYLLQVGVTDDELAENLDLTIDEWMRVKEKLPLKNIQIAQVLKQLGGNQNSIEAISKSIKKARHEARAKVRRVVEK